MNSGLPFVPTPEILLDPAEFIESPESYTDEIVMSSSILKLMVFDPRSSYRSSSPWWASPQYPPVHGPSYMGLGCVQVPSDLKKHPKGLEPRQEMR